MPTITRIISGDTAASLTLLTLVRSDTNAAQPGVTLPDDFTDAGGGVWTYAFTDASPPASYSYTYRRTWSDTSFEDAAGTLVGTGTPSGVYGDISDVRAEMGEFNEGAAADADGNSSSATIALHEQKAINFADAFINSRLASAGFATPATASLGMLKIIFGKLAAWQLYRIRGQQDAKDKFSEKYDWAQQELDELIFQNRGAFTRASGYSDAPAAVAATVLEDGTPVSTVQYAPRWNGVQWVW